MPIIVANLYYVLTITVVKQVHCQLAPNSDFNWNVSLVEKARLIVHLLLGPIFLSVLKHVLKDLFDFFTAFSLLFT